MYTRRRRIAQQHMWAMQQQQASRVDCRLHRIYVTCAPRIHLCATARKDCVPRELALTTSRLTLRRLLPPVAAFASVHSIIIVVLVCVAGANQQEGVVMQDVQHARGHNAGGVIPTAVPVGSFNNPGNGAVPYGQGNYHQDPYGGGAYGNNRQQQGMGTGTAMAMGVGGGLLGGWAMSNMFDGGDYGDAGEL